MSRPERAGPAEHFYDQRESLKYAQNSRMKKIQREMSVRALELLALPSTGQPKYILDLGCGSGLSGAVLEEAGHFWAGMDISRDMLEVANNRLLDDANDAMMDEGEDDEGEDGEGEDGEGEDDEGEEEEEEDDQLEQESFFGQQDPQKCLALFHHDMGKGACFRPGTFDGCISISALQWLCHSNRSSENPRKRLSRLFSTLFGSLRRGARAIFQFYPENSDQIDLILASAMKAGFSGGLVIDYPNSSKAKKYYLCLMTGQDNTQPLPEALTDPTQSINKGRAVRNPHGGRRHKGSTSNKFASKRTKEWIMEKKRLARKRGQATKNDSKYTGRTRKTKF